MTIACKRNLTNHFRSVVLCLTYSSVDHLLIVSPKMASIYQSPLILLWNLLRKAASFISYYELIGTTFDKSRIYPYSSPFQCSIGSIVFIKLIQTKYIKSVFFLCLCHIILTIMVSLAGSLTPQRCHSFCFPSFINVFLSLCFVKADSQEDSLYPSATLSISDYNPLISSLLSSQPFHISAGLDLPSIDYCSIAIVSPLRPKLKIDLTFCLFFLLLLYVPFSAKLTVSISFKALCFVELVFYKSTLFALQQDYFAQREFLQLAILLSCGLLPTSQIFLIRSAYLLCQDKMEVLYFQSFIFIATAGFYQHLDLDLIKAYHSFLAIDLRIRRISYTVQQSLSFFQYTFEHLYSPLRSPGSANT